MITSERVVVCGYDVRTGGGVWCVVMTSQRVMVCGDDVRTGGGVW